MSPFSFFFLSLFSFFFHPLCFAYFLFAFCIVSFCFTLFFIRSLINHKLQLCHSPFILTSRAKKTLSLYVSAFGGKVFCFYFYVYLYTELDGEQLFYSSVRWFIFLNSGCSLFIYFFELYFFEQKNPCLPCYFLVRPFLTYPVRVSIKRI